MLPEAFSTKFNVSRETMAKLEIYHALLLKWQRAVNLVGPGTIPAAWERHFADSAQLLELISVGAKILADLGSGAGFPGMVLAIMRPELEVHLVESDEKKAQFLRTVSRETQVPVTVHNARIEDVYPALTPDVITARALADLGRLLDYAQGWATENPALEMVFLKGEKAQDEIEAARGKYNFDLEAHPSATDPKARLLKICSLRPK